MAALAWLARRGIVVKGSAVLERLATVDTFAFDKTGTLTQGALTLGEVIPLRGAAIDHVLQVAAIAEQRSEHPIARILVKAAQDRGLSIPAPLEFEAVAGAGVIATVQSDLLNVISHHFSMSGNSDLLEISSNDPDEKLTEDVKSESGSFSTIVVGNRHALEHGEVAFSDQIDQLLASSESAGETPLVVAVDGNVIGIVGVRETARPESTFVLEELREIGILRFVLLTGDRPQPADSVVKSLGLFDHVATEQLPADKAKWIEDARREGHRVAMVGDGINDAPALATADVGLALGKAGGDLAAAAGDILLLGDPLSPLPGLVRLSRALVQNIWQSIFLFAFALNGIGVLVCSLQWLNPIGGAMFHEVASLAVMANAMRLLWFEGNSTSAANWGFHRFLEVADWLVVHLSPTMWVYWLIERWQLAAKLVGAMVVMIWLVSGVVQITANEQVIVTRFGRFEAKITAGLHWRWPWPLERMIRESPDRLRSVSVGYRDVREASRVGFRKNNRTATQQDQKNSFSLSWIGRPLVWRPVESRMESRPIIEWTNTHEDPGHSTVSDESLMLTVEEVPVELMAEIQYRISDLKQFLFGGSRRPEDLLRATAESVLREVAASESLDDLLTEQRAGLERKSVLLLRERIDRYQLGIEIIDLQWLDVHPPQSVVPAYRHVADALEDREMLINEADGYATRILLGIVGEQGFELLRNAARTQSPAAIDSPARTDWHLNEDLWRALVKLNHQGQTHLSGSAASVLFEGESASIRHEQKALGLSHRIEALVSEYAAHPVLTRQHLYWKAISETLSQRPLTIIDPTASGRRHLWMAEPTSGRMLPDFHSPPPKETSEGIPRS